MQKLKGTIWALVSSSTFGLIPLFSLPVLTSGVGLDSLCFYRFAFATAAMGAYMLLSGRSLRISWRELATVAVLSVFYGSTSMFLTSSYEFIPSGIATTIHFLYPVLVTTIMIVGFGERFGALQAAGIVVVLAAVVLVIMAERWGRKPLRELLGWAQGEK